MADCLLPRDSAEELMAFFRWAAERRSEDDSSFLTSLRRASSTLMASTRDEDLTERAEVKLALSELNPSTPWEPQTPTYGARCPRCSHAGGSNLEQQATRAASIRCDDLRMHEASPEASSSVL